MMFSVPAVLALAATATANWIEPASIVVPLEGSGKAPEISEVEGSYFKELQSKRAHHKLGPHTIASTVNAAPVMAVGVSAPCDKCIITYFEPGLIFENGTSANWDHGLSINNVFITNEDRKDTTCPDKSQRVYGAGNERQPVDFTVGGTLKKGYELKEGEQFNVSFGLNNFNPGPVENLFLTIDWEYISLDEDLTEFESLTPLWLDLAGHCAPTSRVDVPQGQTEFTLTSAEPWVFPAGDAGLGDKQTVWAAGGHIVDGGVSLDHVRDRGNGPEPACSSVAEYASSPEYIDARGTKHLSDMSNCFEMGLTQPGDKWTVSGHFNFNRHTPAGPPGSPLPVVGVSTVYLGARKFT